MSITGYDPWSKVFREPRGGMIAIAILADGLVAALVVAAIPLTLSQAFHFDKLHVAAYFVIYAAAGTLLNLLAGKESDRRTARYKVTGVAGAACTTGYVLLSVSTLPPVVYLAGVLASTSLVLFSQLFAAARASLFAHWRPQEQTIGMTTLRTVFTLGYVTGTLAASGLLRLVPLREMPCLLAACLFLVSILAVSAIRGAEGHAAAQETPPAARGAPARPVFGVVPLLSLAALFLLQGADSTRNVYLPLVEYQAFQDAGIAPLMFSISAAAELVTTTAAGYLAARVGESRTIALGGLLGAAYFCVLSFGRSLGFLYAANVLYAVFIAGLMGVAMSFVFRLVPDRAGTGGALYLATFSGGTLFGAVSPLALHGYSPRVFLVSVGLCAAGSLLILAAGRALNADRGSGAVRAAAR